MKNQNQAKYIRVYYYGLLGAFGGLSGWFLSALAFRGVESLELTTFGIRGLILGGLIGLFVAAYDGIVSRAPRRLLLLGLRGLGLGALAGGPAFLLAQWLFSAGASPARTFIVGMACWVIVGGTIGLVEVFGKGTQAVKGLIGGAGGGIVGGAIYEAFRASMSVPGANPSQEVQAASLAFMGAGIGLGTALIPTLLRSAWIEVLDGKFAGYQYDVTKYVSRERGGRGVRGVIGSDELRANLYLPADKEVLPQHAVLCYYNEAPTLQATPEAQKGNATLFVNDYPVSKALPLSDKDEIQIGTTRLRYHQSRKASYH